MCETSLIEKEIHKMQMINQGRFDVESSNVHVYVVKDGPT